MIKYKTASGVVARPSPVIIVWTMAKGTYIDAAIISATWVSGVNTTTRLNLYAGQDGAYTMQRPSLPGMQLDNDYASKAATQQDSSAEGLIFLLQGATVAMDAYSKSKRSQANSYTAAPSYEQLPMPATPLPRRAPVAPRGYQTTDAYGVLVNSRDIYQTRDSQGSLVSSKDNFQTRDSFGNLVNSRDNFQTKDSFGNIVQSGD